MRARGACIAIVAGISCAIAPAAASTIEALSPARLYAEADRVVDGTVRDVRTRWDPRGNGLETVATIAIETTWRGPATATVELVIPGGTLGTTQQIVLGAPAIARADRARWFLRDRGDGRLGVYGWAQGKWPARIVDGRVTYAPEGVAAEHATNVALFVTNGMVWPAASLPVPYLIHTAGSADLPMSDVVAAIDAAFATWQAVPCSALGFRNAGFTDQNSNTDNVILFLESNWVHGAEAAAATSLWIIDGQQTADIAMNGVNFTWANGPSNSLLASTLDLQSVLTHEIGHFSGLGHSARAYDTMYYSWKPWQGQRTLSIDDKLGLCSIYPAAGSECPAPACPSGETCTALPLGQLCAGRPDPIGTPCNYDRIECDAFCLFTALDLSTGYCSRFCIDDSDCPLTHHCAEATAGAMLVHVCFAGPHAYQPEPDPPRTCAQGEACPRGQHCDAARGACTFECRTDADCALGTCDERGTCGGVIAGGGAGCRSHDASCGFGLLLVATFTGLRRRRGSRKLVRSR